MLFSVSIAAITGVAIGLFFRGGALILASLGLTLYSLVSNSALGTNTLYALGITFALLCVLQAGYFCGLYISALVKKTFEAPSRYLTQCPDESPLVNRHSDVSSGAAHAIPSSEMGDALMCLRSGLSNADKR